MSPHAPQAESAERKVETILADMVDATGALTALLISREGTSMAEAGHTEFMNTTALAALVAGMFSATREVARLVGEEQFSILLQQGERRHIHISLIDDTSMMVIVFEDYDRIGRVRHHARRTARAIAEALSRDEGARGVGEELEVPAFREYALNLIDRIFSDG